MTDGPWRAVDEFLAFVEATEPAQRAEVPQLIRLLDRLAAAVPFERVDDAPETERSPPEQPDLRAQLDRRFPEFWFYATATPLADDGRPALGETGCADAIDDLLDIGRDLRDARWYRDHGEPGDGERYLAQMFRNHWGRHLRDLQSFLHQFVFGG